MDSNVTILLIDDVDVNILVLEQLLNHPQRKFLQATTGEEGLRLALHHDIDLIILDVQMPEMDGFQVAQLLKSGKRTKEIPIIFTSAEKKERKSILQGFEEGAVDFLLKPLDPALTKAKVAALLTVQLQKRELVAKNAALALADKQIKELNAALAHQLEQAERANKELESFSYSVSHDLRAPVRVMTGYASLLIEEFGHKDPELLLSAERIYKNAQKMNQMIDDLLALSRVSKSEMKQDGVNMTALVETVLEEVNAHHPHKANIKFNDLLPAVGDSTLLQHVWTNLLTNAVKYSSKKPAPEVEIGSRDSNGQVIYFVKDNGAGFRMERAAQMFQVFQRLHSATDFEGTGVGLAIVQRIVERHGGRVWAEGKENEGATFYFSLQRVA